MNRTELTQRIKAAAHQALAAKGYISAVDLLMTMGWLTKVNYERWRTRQTPCLEAVVNGNLSQHQFLLRILRAHARDELHLKPSHTAYMSWGCGRRQPLQFSKSGNSHVEQLFSTHYVSGKLAVARPNQQCQSSGSAPELKSSPASTPS